MYGEQFSRRRWLQQTACLLAAGALPRIVTAEAPSVTPVMAKLSAYMSQARDRALPENVAREAEHHILDTIAAMVSGSQLLPGKQAVNFASHYGGEKISTVVASQIV